MALAAYRNILRSARLAFKDDLHVFQASRHEARINFEKNASLEPTSLDYKRAVTHALDVAKILRENVVQGRKIDPDADAESARYKLNIHEHTERGDNNTIKLPGGGTTVIDGKPCSQR